MEKIIAKTLSLLGCDPGETRFFLASFKLGPAGVNDVAKAAHTRRSSAYIIAQSLIAKGLLLEDHKEYGKKVYCLDPKQLLALLSTRQRHIRHQELELEEALPDLWSHYRDSEFRPAVRVFEGNQGLVKIWQDILSTSGEILLWTNQQTENFFFGPKNHDKFIAQRLSRKIPIRVLAVDNPESRELKQQDAAHLRHTKLLPAGTAFSTETYIYDHKIATLDYNKDIVGVIIESAPISASFKAQFELVWSQI